MRKAFSILLIALLGISCSYSGWVSDPTGITVFPVETTNHQAKAVRIEPISDHIIKVKSGAQTTLAESESLVALPINRTAEFTAEEVDGFVVVSTGATSVRVSLKSGEVEFLDAEGKTILQEKSEDIHAFEPVEVDGTQGYALRQVFESPGEEAIYGLGQHQADEINYKGKNEELFQYNTKVSVPFIVSTKNYGLLWDNYSLTRYGDPRPYGQMDQFVQYDMDGNKGGLTATYVDDAKTGHVFLKRTESQIDYENLETIENFPEGFDFNNALITWEGQIEPAESGIFRFLLYYAGYTKIWIDGELLANKWRTAWNPSVAKFSKEMTAGTKYHVKLEWIPDGGVSYIGLKALTPVDESAQNNISFFSEMGKQIEYYFINGQSIDEVIGHYRKLTGKAQVMPKWSMGFWQSRERYKTQDELVGTLKEFRKRGIPIDNIVQDWSYWETEQWGSHEFDAARFPDPAGMVKEVHDLNARIMISVWPKYYLGTDNYEAFDKNGWMYKQAINDSIRDWIYPGFIGSFYDAYHPEARKLFWQQIDKHLYSKGFDAWWLDATEPDILSNASIDYRKALMNPTYLGPSTEYFNAYALMNAKGIYEGQREKNPEDRVFILTRSGFAGMQRYGTVTWSGDIGTVWEDLKSQIPAGINFSMSGLPYWTMDIGGFCVQKKFERATEGSEEMEEWRELNTRWTQFGAFVPLFRAHGQFPFREIYHIAPDNHPAYQSMLWYNKLRYRLMPYIYSLAGMVYHNDYTIMRGLAMDFPNDQNVWDIGDQYMFGPSFLVCPVHQYKERQREVYFPAGTGWYDLYSGQYTEGGKTAIAEAPYERMPVFVKAGSIIPVGPEIQHTAEKQDGPIDIYVYSGKDGDFALYEDEGTNYGYEQGQFSSIRFTWSEEAKSLTIHAREGSFEGMPSERTFRIRMVSPEKPAGMLSAVEPMKEINYTGEEVIINN